MVEHRGGLRTWIEVSRAATRRNLRLFKRRLGRGTRLLAVVKSNAYGHELVGFSKLAAGAGADWLGVDSITEGLALRRAGLHLPVLVQGYTLPENLSRAADSNLSVTVSSWENLKLLPKLKKNLAVHLKVDTGMHRHGFQLPELPEVLNVFRNAPRASLEGLYTHLAAAKEPRFRKQSTAQLAAFKGAVRLARAAGFSPICHAAATGGALWYPQAHYGMVRVGIGLYGLWPSPETEARFKKTVPLVPAMTWKSVVAELKWVEKGERVGYNFTERLARPSRLALVPVGYWHGYGRRLSGKSHVLVRGRRCKIVGLVSMDILTVDVTDAPGTHVGDEVVLIGRQGKEHVTAAELAEIAGTTAYEIVTRTNPLIKKFFV